MSKLVPLPSAKQGETMDLDEANEFATVPFTGVSKPPKAVFKPKLVVPQIIIDQEIEGRVEVLLTVDAEGRVAAVQVLESLHPEADKACVAAVKSSRWKPGLKGETPVIVQGVPYTCRFEMSKG